jgi:prepilin-type processing-associated H-X9-DG protein
MSTLGGGQYSSANIDFGGGVVWNAGNARFRHNGLGCNVAFQDGSVRTLFLNPRRTVAGTGGNTYVDCEFRRYMLMIKWPTGLRDTVRIRRIELSSLTSGSGETRSGVRQLWGGRRCFRQRAATSSNWVRFVNWHAFVV